MSVILGDAVIYACVLAVLCVGLSLTYKVTNVPNFAHTSFALLGMYTALVVTKVASLSPYVAIPCAFALSGSVSLLLYWGVLRVLRERRASYLSLIIATLSFDIFMIGVLNILADSVSSAFKVTSRDFTLRSFDAVVGGVPMVLVASVAVLAGLVVGLYYLLYRTRFGIAMRASIDNGSLASTLGVDTNRMFCVSWFCSGGLGGIAGVLMALWFQGDPTLAAIMLPSVFAGSIVGGFSSIYGAILGGVIVGVSEVAGTSLLASLLGYWVVPYRPLIPFLFIIATLMVSPRGVAAIVEGVRERRAAGARRAAAGGDGGGSGGGGEEEDEGGGGGSGLSQADSSPGRSREEDEGGGGGSGAGPPAPGPAAGKKAPDPGGAARADPPGSGGAGPAGGRGGGSA